jgi:hypothetical protein
MNGRILKILIFVLCGAFILIAGCTTTAPPGGAAPTQTVAQAGQVSAVSTDLATIISLLQTTNAELTLIAENTHPPGKGIVTGNLVLLDTEGNMADTITNGTSVVALPQGTCDIALYGNSVQMYVTVEEMKDYQSDVYTRNRQSCIDVYLCRKTVTLDGDFSYVYLTYKPYTSQYRLDRITLSYRCNPV